MPKGRARAPKPKEPPNNDWLAPQIGEYDDALSDRSPAVMTHRQAFLNAIAQYAPQVLRDLRESVLPLYFDALPELPQNADLSRWVEVVKRSTTESQHLLRFVGGMRNWSARYGLHAGWIYDAAYFTLTRHLVHLSCEEGPGPGEVKVLAEKVSWFDFKALTEYRFLFTDPALKYDDEDIWIANGRLTRPPPPVSYLGGPESEHRIWDASAELFIKASSERYFVHCEGPWEPMYEKWAAFEARARQSFESKLRAYREAVEGIAAKTQPMRRPAEVREYAMFDWLALWQCCHRSHREIAEIAGDKGRQVEESAIHHGINRAAALIGLTSQLRAGSRGKKRKK